MDKQNEIDKIFQEFHESVKETVRKNEENESNDQYIDIVIVDLELGPYEANIRNTTEARREIIDGYSDNFYIDYLENGGRIAIVLDDESKLKNLPLNRILVGPDGQIMDTIHGNFLITAYNSKGFNISLTQKQIEDLVNMFLPRVVQIK